MPINFNQPNVYQYGASWTTEANEYHTTSLITKYQETNSGGTGRLARRRSHGTVRRRLAGGGGGGGGGGRSIGSAFLFTAALRHAILHWSVRKQPQRIEFEISSPDLL